MSKDSIQFLLKLIGFTAIIMGVHYYLVFNFFSDLVLFFPIWSLYLFNAVLVFIVYFFINYKVSRGNDNPLTIFLALTGVKMLLAIILLLPVFMGKALNPKAEVFNFFIPYFFYLTFEIIAISNFLKNQETK